MPTRFLKSIPDDEYTNILTDTSTSLDPAFVVGQKYNAQAVGSSKLFMIELATKPTLNDVGIAMEIEGTRIPFIVEAGLGIWIRSASGNGTVVINDSEA